MRRLLRTVVFTLLLGCGLAPLCAQDRLSAESAIDRSGIDRQEYFELYQMLAEAVAQVEMNYAHPVERRQLFESAIQGMLADLDPYSAYLSPEKLKRYQNRFQRNGASSNRETVIGVARSEGGAWRFVARDQPLIGYAAVISFTQSTPQELRAIVQQLVDQEARALVLDLRWNAGGLLSAAVDTADLFLTQGTIVATEGRNTKRRTWRASQRDSFVDLPLVVIVNHQSASGAEVVAAALQDNGRATVVGQRTWGKGSVQNVIEIAEGRGAIKLTTASYFRPSGANIHRFPGYGSEDAWGVRPAAKWRCRLSATEAEAILKQRNAWMADHNVESDVATVVDRQLQLAIQAIDSAQPQESQ